MPGAVTGAVTGPVHAGCPLPHPAFGGWSWRPKLGSQIPPIAWQGAQVPPSPGQQWGGCEPTALLRPGQAWLCRRVHPFPAGSGGLKQEPALGPAGWRVVALISLLWERTGPCLEFAHLRAWHVDTPCPTSPESCCCPSQGKRATGPVARPTLLLGGRHSSRGRFRWFPSLCSLRVVL